MAVASVDQASLLYLIKRLEMAVRKRLTSVLDEYGLTLAQYTALTSLDRQPDMTAASLARHSFVAAQTTAELVRALEARGLVLRRTDPSSRRQALLSLTPEGRRMLDELRPAVAGIEEAIAPAGAAALRRALDDMRRNLES